MNACCAKIKWILVSLAITRLVAAVDDSSNGVTHMLRSKGQCSGYKYIPFAITNIAAKDVGNGKVRYGYHSNGYPKKLFFLKDVILCDAWWSPYEITGTKLDPDQFKAEVKKYIDSDTSKYHVLYNIHGWSEEPLSSYDQAAKYNDNNHDYLVIPIQWRSTWGPTKMLEYESMRNNRAPLMGKLLAEKSSVFQADYPTSIMCHSMGNYVFRVFAQNVSNPTTMFRNFFSVAADARMDMFSSEFNPDTNISYEVSKKASLADTQGLDIPADETRPNGGIAISKVATNSHIVWNWGDHALLIRETFQMGFGDGLRKALGKYGWESEEAMDAFFVDKVKFHDFSATVREFGVEHLYQWYTATQDLYKLYINTDIATANKEEDPSIKEEM